MGAILTSFFSYLTKWLVYCAAYGAGVVAGLADGILYYLQLVFLKIVNTVIDVVTATLDASGVASAITTINGAFSGALGFYAEFFHVPQAAAAMGSAYMIRFVIRRLPVVG